MVKLQEAENQIVIAYEVYDQRPNDQDILMTAIETHQARLGRTPHLVAADAGFYSGKNEAAAKAKGVKRVCIPNRSTKSPQRKREQKKRWFRNGQKWRTGSEGRISVVKRPARTEPQPIQGRHWHQALGWPWCDRRQPGQHQSRHGQAARPVGRTLCPLTSRQRLSDAGARPASCAAFQKPAFCAESSYAFSQTKLRKSGPCGQFEVGVSLPITCPAWRTG
jgi:hypothetical protein